MYHVTSRGVRKADVFTDARDRLRFQQIFQNVVERLEWRCHTYCLMTNHFHLLIETPRADVSAGMQRLNGIYAQWFNWRHGFEGHLFDRRFGSVLVEGHAHLLELTRYIVLNPVRAGRVAMEQLRRHDRRAGPAGVPGDRLGPLALQSGTEASS